MKSNKQMTGPLSRKTTKLWRKSCLITSYSPDDFLDVMRRHPSFPSMSCHPKLVLLLTLPTNKKQSRFFMPSSCTICKSVVELDWILSRAVKTLNKSQQNLKQLKSWIKYMKVDDSCRTYRGKKSHQVSSTISLFEARFTAVYCTSMLPYSMKATPNLVLSSLTKCRAT